VVLVLACVSCWLLAVPSYQSNLLMILFGWKLRYQVLWVVMLCCGLWGCRLFKNERLARHVTGVRVYGYLRRLVFYTEDTRHHVERTSVSGSFVSKDATTTPFCGIIERSPRRVSNHLSFCTYTIVDHDESHHHTTKISCTGVGESHSFVLCG
jgi:hypothetical protein